MRLMSPPPPPRLPAAPPYHYYWLLFHRGFVEFDNASRWRLFLLACFSSCLWRWLEVSRCVVGGSQDPVGGDVARFFCSSSHNYYIHFLPVCILGVSVALTSWGTHDAQANLPETTRIKVLYIGTKLYNQSGKNGHFWVPVASSNRLLDSESNL